MSSGSGRRNCLCKRGGRDAPARRLSRGHRAPFLQHGYAPVRSVFRDCALLLGGGRWRKFSRVKSYQEYDINYFQDEDGMFTAEVPAIRGCVAWGKTLVEAHQNAVEAIEGCLEARAKVAAKKPRYAGLNIYRRPVQA